MRKPMIAPALSAVLAVALALAPAALEAQATGRATGTARSSGIGIADRIGVGSGVSSHITGTSITARGFGTTRFGSHSSGRVIRSTRGRSIGVATSPFGTIQHCAGVSVVTASSIWGASIRNCGRHVKTKRSVTAGILPVAYPVYVPAPYGYYEYFDYGVPIVAGGTPFITAAVPVATTPTAARTIVFDASRPYVLVWPPLLYGMPVPLYTAGDAVIYVERAPPPPTVVQGGAAAAAAPQSACARLTVILSTGDGWWKTVWLPALGASTIEALRAAVDAQLADAPLVITDATGARIDVPVRSAVRSVMVDRCPQASGGR